MPANFNYIRLLTSVTDHDDLEDFVRFQALVVLFFWLEGLGM
jgi:hypothetical protein